jgi:hypothetical protein
MISHFVKVARIQDEKLVTRTLIWCKDNLETDCNLLDPKAALEHAHKYNSQVTETPPIMFPVKVTVVKPCDSIQHQTYLALRLIHGALETQLESLRDKVREKADAVVFEMLVALSRCA